MNTKMKSAIVKIEMNLATFRGITFEPTYINFFYGNNGTGKTTIARLIGEKDMEIGQSSRITWQVGKSAADYSVLIYNQRFVEVNFRN